MARGTGATVHSFFSRSTPLHDWGTTLAWRHRFSCGLAAVGPTHRIDSTRRPVTCRSWFSSFMCTGAGGAESHRLVHGAAPWLGQTTLAGMGRGPIDYRCRNLAWSQPAKRVESATWQHDPRHRPTNANTSIPE